MYDGSIPVLVSLVVCVVFQSVFSEPQFHRVTFFAEKYDDSAFIHSPYYGEKTLYFNLKVNEGHTGQYVEGYQVDIGVFEHEDAVSRNFDNPEDLCVPRQSSTDKEDLQFYTPYKEFVYALYNCVNKISIWDYLNRFDVIYRKKMDDPSGKFEIVFNNNATDTGFTFDYFVISETKGSLYFGNVDTESSSTNAKLVHYNQMDLNDPEFPITTFYEVEKEYTSQFYFNYELSLFNDLLIFYDDAGVQYFDGEKHDYFLKTENKPLMQENEVYNNEMYFTLSRETDRLGWPGVGKEIERNPVNDLPNSEALNENYLILWDDSFNSPSGYKMYLFDSRTQNKTLLYDFRDNPFVNQTLYHRKSGLSYYVDDANSLYYFAMYGGHQTSSYASYFFSYDYKAMQIKFLGIAKGVNGSTPTNTYISSWCVVKNKYLFAVAKDHPDDPRYTPNFLLMFDLSEKVGQNLYILDTICKPQYDKYYSCSASTLKCVDDRYAYFNRYPYGDFRRDLYLIDTDEL